MTLAFTCGKWDYEAFRDEISAYLMNGWRQWFSRRPQGQYHLDQMLAGLGATLSQIQGCDVTPQDFMHGYPPPPPDKQSQAAIDLNVMMLSALQPKKPPEPEQTDVQPGRLSLQPDRECDELRQRERQGACQQ